MNNRKYFNQIHINIKKSFILKKSSTSSNLLEEKPINWFAIAKIWEIYLKRKETLIKGLTCLFKISLWNGFPFLYVQINQLVSLYVEHQLQWVITNNQWFENINGLHQTILLYITWCIVPFKSKKSWFFFVNHYN